MEEYEGRGTLSGLRALVLCAGKGTRLSPYTQTKPKALVDLGGKPLLVHLLQWLRYQGVTDIAVNLHYHAEAIPAALGNGTSLGIRLIYSYEPELLGTAGAVRKLAGWFSDPFLVIYGDLLTDVDLAPLVQFHRSQGALATLGLVPGQEPTWQGIVVRGPRCQVQRFVEKPTADQVAKLRDHQGIVWASAGLYVLSVAALAYVPPDTPLDFGYDLIPQWVEGGQPVYGIPLIGYLLDVGTPERLALGEEALRKGWVMVREGEAIIKEEEAG